MRGACKHEKNKRISVDISVVEGRNDSVDDLYLI